MTIYFVSFPIKNGGFHGYVSLPEGTYHSEFIQDSTTTVVVDITELLCHDQWTSKSHGVKLLTIRDFPK